MKRYYFTVMDGKCEIDDHCGNIKGARTKAQKYANEHWVMVYINSCEPDEIVDTVDPTAEGKPEEKPAHEVLKGFKGFSEGLICRGKQYAEDTVYEEESAEICKSGMHFCKFPFDVFGYYPPCDENGQLNEYATVEAIGDIKEDGNKCCTDKLKIGKKLSLHEFVQMGVDYIIERVKNEEVETGSQAVSSSTGNWAVSSSTGPQAVSSSTGDWAVSSSTGFKAVSSSTGFKAVSSSTGDWAVSSSTGNWAVSSSTGFKTVSSSTGDWAVSSSTGSQAVSSSTGSQAVSSSTGSLAVSSSTGDWAVSSSTGFKAVSSSTGSQAVSSVKGKESIAVAIGYKSKAAGALGCWIVVAEWDENADHIIDMKLAKVDGEKIKPDTFYTLENGEFVEVKQ